MGTIGGALRGLSPHSLLRLYLVVVVITAIIAIGAVQLTSSRVDSNSREAAQQTSAAITASRIQGGLREPLLVLVMNTYKFLLSTEEFPTLTAQQKGEVLGAIIQQASNPGPALVAVPDVAVPMSDRDAITLQRSVDLYTKQIDSLAANAGGVSLTGVLVGRDRLVEALEAYLDDDSAANFRNMLVSLVSLSLSLDAVGDQFARNVSSAQLAASNASHTASLVTVVGLAAMASTMALATFFVSRLIRRAFLSSETERVALRETTRTLQYRNDQLSALYAVFSEITDTLSMPYVVSATLRETLRVMNGTMVVLRLVQNGELVVVGNLTDEGREISDLPPVPLGEGPTGRVARRGRSLRIERGAQALLGPGPIDDDPNGGVESGIIVPLIVGARVVGTLACWSRQESMYGEEDERVLEMMASQVATAVVAADNAESSERRALRDPLTGLPNRRQLTDDLASHFAGDPDKATPTAFVMIDIDHFKRLNDDFGHRVGDVSLQKIAAVMRNAMRDGDTIYRYGGEEFVAIFRGASGKEALVAAERLRTAVETTPLTGDQLEPVGPVTISLGIALLPDHGTEVNDLIEMADKALYRAKQAGRNRVEVWEEESLRDKLTVA